MNSSKAALVVAPGYPPELLQELLEARLLPSSTDLAVLLPPAKRGPYNKLMEKKHFSGVRFLPSPGRRFFSLPHLKWLRANLRASKNNMVVVANSLDRDLTSALVAFVALLLSGKSVAHFRHAQASATENEKPGLDSTTQSLSGRWISKEFNPKVLAREILVRVTVAPPGQPWKRHEILYFLMFTGLIIKHKVLKNVFSLSHKLRKK